ncbi:MAG: putative bifunctional diguanylate cyclase/phosphodiesterase [Myxococcota bacterium]
MTTRPPSDRASASRRVAVAWVFLALAGLGMVATQRYVVRHARAEAALARLRCAVTAETSLEWQAIYRGNIDADVVTRLRTARADGATALAEATALSFPLPVGDLPARLAEFQDAVDGELRALEDLDPEEAAHFDDPRVDVAHAAFIAEVDRLQAAASRASAGASKVGGVAALLLLAMSGLVTATLGQAAERRRSEAALARARAERLERSEARLRGIVQGSADLLLVTDADGHVTWATPSTGQLLGRAAGQLVGASIGELVGPDETERLVGLEERHGADGSVSAIVAWRRRDGSTVLCETRCVDLLADPSVRGRVYSARDVTERVELEALLEHQASHDPLTGLASRALLYARIDAWMATRRASEHAAALVILDLDDFKGVNDTLGHSEGDRLLVTLAERFAARLRPGDVAARIGGDEFAFFLPVVHDEADVRALLGHLLDDARRPVAIQGTAHVGTASAGVAFAPAHARNAEDLLRAADLAMYASKRQGKDRAVVFDDGLARAAAERESFLQDMRVGLGAGQFVAWFQPIFDIARGEPVGVEALARWHHPTRGLVPPQQFVGLAEDTGLVGPLGEAVARAAARCVRGWQTGLGRSTFGLSLNVSVRQLTEPDACDRFLREILSSGLDPSSVTIEVTETVFSPDQVSVMDALRRLRAAGARISLDDFGTGYSSLAYLRDFPVSEIKIDRSFVARLGEDRPDAVSLVRTIIELGRALGLEAVAEGVETPEQLAILRRLGCARAQGYFLAPPGDASRIEALLRAHPSWPAPDRDVVSAADRA